MFRTALQSLCFCVSLSVGVLGCGSPDPSDDDMGTGNGCESNIDCLDGDACNGLEVCAPANVNADALGCISGAPVVCTAPDTCNPASGVCVSPCDLDSDGVESVSCGGADCDDEDANRFPGNPETCTTALGALDPATLLHDEDCDPDTLGDDLDEDTFYRQECANPQGDGMALYGVDCDDDNDLRRPGLVEVCDGLDNDCVGGLNFPGEDNDVDGYADCVDLMGQANYDCNDADAAVHPNATDACDGLDADCDGYVEDEDNDGFAAVGAPCTGGSMPATDCDDARAETNPDAPETCNGGDDDCSGTDDDNNAVASCAAIARFAEPLCAGGCTVTCDEGFADCDGLASSGCEVDTARSLRDCGSCGNVCPFGCRDGVCLRATQLTAGGTHSCALLETGAVQCWGWNLRGALGNGQPGDLTEPTAVPVVGIDGTSDERSALRVAAGTAFTCALMADGTVSCWGNDVNGTLGSGSGSGATNPVPVTVPGIDGVTNVAIDVAAGGGHACAVLSDGSVLCWGRDTGGVLGNGVTPADIFGPVQVSGLGGSNPHATRVVAGTAGSCALLETGAVMCWGSSGVGNCSASTQHVPVPVTGIDGVQRRATSLTASEDRACARLDTGALTCWNTTPTVVPGLDGVSASVSQASVSLFHACAVIDDGAVVCWGQDISGQVGDGVDDGDDEPLPTPVVGLGGGSSGVLEVACGAQFSCALLMSGQVRCWGGDSVGQLGDGPNAASKSAPVAMEPGVVVRHVSTGETLACATLDTGAAYCWGGDLVGQIGNGGDDTTKFAPAAVSGIDGVAASALEVHAAGSFACALLATGAVVCWGGDGDGQLGDGDNGQTSRDVPVSVVGIDGVTGRAVGLSVGEAHACAVLDTGALRCWGRDLSGQVGNGGANAATVLTPTPVVGLDGGTDLVVGVSAGVEHTCAWLQSGEVRCWGENTFGQLGHASANMTEGSPVTVSGLDGTAARATLVSAGWQHTCAILATGEARCWGMDLGGQLGDGDDDEAEERSPVAVLNLGNAVSVNAGAAHTCATTADGRALCWGANLAGALGTGDANSVLRHVPTPVAGLSGDNLASSVSAGYLTSCAVSEVPALQCWGEDTSGEVGDGDDGQAAQFTPIRVRFP